jgi:hypothetical protein
MNKIFNAPNRKEIVLVMAMVLLAMPGVSRGEAYLRVFGPPPLRFAYVDNDNAVFLSELALPKSKPVEQPPMPAPQAAAKSDTNNVAGGTVANPSTTLDGTPLLPLPGKNPPASDNPASNMLRLTPEMISDYFKPYRAEGGADPGSFQSGETIFVPAELGFVPPGSRATYISK